MKDLTKVYDPTSNADRFYLANAILDLLEEAGFQLEPMNSPYNEMIWTKTISSGERGVTVLNVATSISLWQGKPYMRANGTDAIRVYLTFEKFKYNRIQDRTRGLGKATRVNRTGVMNEVLKRLKQRIKTVEAKANKNKKCSCCGSPTFVAKKSGKDTCAALCWLDKSNAA